MNPPIYFDSLLNRRAVEAAQHRVRLELDVLAAACAYVGDVPDDLTPELFRFDDLRLIFTTLAYHGPDDLTDRLRDKGYWNHYPERRALDAMLGSMAWSDPMLVALCQSSPRGRMPQTVRALTEHHRRQREAAEHLSHAAKVLDDATGAGAVARSLTRRVEIARERREPNVATGMEMRLESLLAEQLSQPQLHPIELGQWLVSLSRFAQIPVTAIADKFNDMDIRRRRVA